ncbi:hypothetical protein N9917_00595 [Deltaproteobacteria bacterium]|nr:hypothetical protein [Deltaproteobacteria bacterium]
MTEFAMCMAALSRPLDYGQRHPQSQWNIDAGLGILDWDGINLANAGKVIEAGDEAAAQKQFKMSLSELRQITEGFDKRIAAQGA